MGLEETVSNGQSLVPPDGWSWFLRDTDSHYSHKRAIAIFLTSLFTWGCFHDWKYEILSLIAMLMAGYSGLSLMERFQPK